MPRWIMYTFPMVFDIIVGLTLFAGRHAFGEGGRGIGTVGGVWLIYGVGYTISSMIMSRVVRPHRARPLMLAAAALAVVLLVFLANAHDDALILALFAGIPVATSLFFNSFQSFMLSVDQGGAKPFVRMIGHYTFAWSIGYALGPAITVMAREMGSWSAVYYTAASITAVLFVVALRFKPRPVPADVSRPAPAPILPAEAVGTPSLCVPAWIGIVVGLCGWSMISTFWPVQAEALHYSTRIKGAAEFAAAAMQALVGLSFAYLPVWHFRPSGTALFALGGIGGALLFASGGHPAIFIAGGALFGVYSAAYFSLIPFHALLDPAKAVGAWP
ncbi:MAG: MFS transporter [Planctomycetota bacterium]